MFRMCIRIASVRRFLYTSTTYFMEKYRDFSLFIILIPTPHFPHFYYMLDGNLGSLLYGDVSVMVSAMPTYRTDTRVQTAQAHSPWYRCHQSGHISPGPLYSDTGTRSRHPTDTYIRPDSLHPAQRLKKNFYFYVMVLYVANVGHGAIFTLPLLEKQIFISVKAVELHLLGKSCSLGPATVCSRCDLSIHSIAFSLSNTTYPGNVKIQ